MAKNRKPHKKQIRWEIPEELHEKIATYQKSNKLRNLNIAGVILLEKITQDIRPLKPIEL